MENRYSKYLTTVQKKTGYRSEVLVVKSESIKEFISDVIKDPDLDIQLKLLVCMGIGSGGRITELLKIKKEQVTEGKYFKLSVLKKDRAQVRKEKEALARGEKPKPWNPVHRVASVPKEAQALFKEFLLKRKPHEYLFKGISRHNAYYAMKKHFGEGFECHSLRRSYISYLLSLGKTTPQIAEIVKLDERTVQNYTHITNFEEELDAIGL